MKTMRTGLIVFSTLTLVFSACSDHTSDSGDGGNNPSCFDVSGNWRMSFQCDLSGGGADGTMIQNGCNLPYEYGDGDEMVGSIDENGQVVLQDGPDGDFGSCSGSVEGDLLNAQCSNNNCSIELERL